ncbi:Vps62-related protein [Pseudomonas sp. lyk4-TYG-107]|uniref:Vps62-related protein n=1 Tax=Pseudomonas sp. lyk4-TYG-107 TaxID=3040317 RepID=UPI0025575EB4|nr:Vps62-related protein [Pseudomonas sp. lyk4-TYG-107]
MTIHDQAAAPSRQIEPIRHDNLLIHFTTEFHRIWDSTGSRAKPAAFWRPTPAPDVLPGYFPLGDVFVAGHDNINGSTVVAVVCEADAPSADPARGPALRRPDDFELIWKDSGSGSKKDGAVWRPIAPQGYVAMGAVCSNDHEKPSLNAVRCVRADLVIASDVGELIWNDKGSGARQSFSAWSVTPTNAPPGEIHFAPGTFVGASSFNRPESNVGAYSLRMQIAPLIQSSPQLPMLLAADAPETKGAATLAQVIELPWFVVKDDLSPIDQLRTTPFYRLERTDQYYLVGSGHNTGEEARAFKWTAQRLQNPKTLRLFTQLTAISFVSPWATKADAHPSLPFSARLDSQFTHSETSTSGWQTPFATYVIAMAGKGKFVAVYQLESFYELRRADGSQAGINLAYTQNDNLSLLQYPPQECTHQATDKSLPTATDSAP